MKFRRHRRRRSAKALAIDLGWSRSNWRRTAVAWSDARSGRVKVDLLGPEEWIEDWVRDLMLPGGLVGLDIPVEGIEQLGPGGQFRPVDQGMIKMGTPLLPSVRAGSHGREVADRVRKAVPECTVVEIYPFAVLRVLWSLTYAGLERPVRALDGEEWASLLQERAWKEFPPRYKRACGRDEVARRLRRVSTVLDGSPYGQALDDLSDDPFATMRRADLDRMSDALDALLGMVALDRYVRRSPFAKVFAVPGHPGGILGLADAWLWSRWQTTVRGLA